MNIVCIGGGPAGLYFGILMKKQDPVNEIVVIERNRPYDTFGWGVVFSDQTLGNLVAADEKTARTILQAFNHWDDIDVFFKGRTSHVQRSRLLRHRPQAVAQHPAGALRGTRRQAGVRDQRRPTIARWRRPTAPTSWSPATASTARIRTRYAGRLPAGYRHAPLPLRLARHEEAVRRLHVRLRARPSTAGSRRTFTSSTANSTFIVETPEEVWLKAGLDRMSQEEGIPFCEKLFAARLDGHPLLSNATHLRGSAIWIKFPRIVCGNWVHWIDVAGKRCRWC